MGQGGLIFCEWDSVKKEFPDFQRAFAELEAEVIGKCDAEWQPKTYGFLSPSNNQYGATSILPALFDDINAAQMAHWRQQFVAGQTGNQTIITGTGTGNIIPEDFKIGWIGLAFPNKQQQISELRWQISDKKYPRINIEEMHGYNKPAIIFEKGYILNEQESFDLYAYIEEADYQRVVMIGAAYYKVIDKVLGNCGAAI